jgi:hypothetical protein
MNHEPCVGMRIFRNHITFIATNVKSFVNPHSLIYENI